MSKEEFKIPNEEFKNQLLYLLSNNSEFLEKVRKAILMEEIPTEIEVSDKKDEIDINEDKKDEIGCLRGQLSKAEENILELKLEIKNIQGKNQRREMDISEKKNKELDYLREKLSEKEESISELEFKIKEMEEDVNLLKKLSEGFRGLLKNTEEDKQKLEIKSNHLEKEVDKYTNENNELKENNYSLKEKKDGYKHKLSINEDENRKLKEKLNGYEGQFADMIEVHKKYLNLSSRTKESLSGIFKDESLMGFVACGIQESNIESLWDYIKDEIKEEKYEGVNELKEIFEYLFNLYQLSNPKYGWQEIKIGTNFDTEDHIRHSSGKVSGKIEEIMLKGYENKKNKRIIKKSLVKVG